MLATDHVNIDGIFSLDDYLPYNLVSAADQVVKLIRREQKIRFGMSLAEWRLIATLATEGPLSHQAIGKRAILEALVVSRAAALLLEKQLIFRHSGGDRRVRLLELTQAGIETYQKLVPLAFAIADILLIEFSSEEQRFLIQSLKKIRATAERAFANPEIFPIMLEDASASSPAP